MDAFIPLIADLTSPPSPMCGMYFVELSYPMPVLPEDQDESSKFVPVHPPIGADGTFHFEASPSAMNFISLGSPYPLP